MLNTLNLFLFYKQLLDSVNLLVPPTVSLVLSCHDSVNLQRNYFNYPPFLSVFSPFSRMSKPPVEGTFLSYFSSPEAIRIFSCQVIFSSSKSHWISTSQSCEVDFCRKTPAAGEGRHKLRGDCQRNRIRSLIYVRFGKAIKRPDLLYCSLDFKCLQPVQDEKSCLQHLKTVSLLLLCFVLFCCCSFITIILNAIRLLGEWWAWEERWRISRSQVFWIQPKTTAVLAQISVVLKTGFWASWKLERKHHKLCKQLGLCFMLLLTRHSLRWQLKY